MRTSRSIVSLVLAALGLAACAPSSTSSRPAPPATPAAAAPDPAAPPMVVEPPRPDEAEVKRRERAEQALARTPQIKEALAALRALAFTADVPAEYQTTDAFKTFVKAEVARELPPDKADAMTTSFHHVGLLPEKIDLGSTIADALVTQAAAYYDPRQKKFFVVMVPDEAIWLDLFTAHELTHALQDQHFDLLRYLEPTGVLENDVLNARRYIVEGEATVTMFAYVIKASNGKDPMTDQAAWPFLKLQLANAAGMSIDDMTALTKQQAAGLGNIDAELAASMAAMDKIPLVILVPMLESYMKGTQPVVAAYEHGGWPAVDALYATPPDSTEQVLHPDTKLYPQRDLPKKVTLPDLPGYTEVHTNVMGELEWRIYFMVWNKPIAERAAAGWDGDRWRVVRDGAGTLVGLLVSTWDSPEEATEFADAYRATIATRFPDKAREVWVKTRGANVYIVDGGTDPKLIDRLVKGARIR